MILRDVRLQRQRGVGGWGGQQLVVQQLPTCSTLFLDDSCIWSYFCRKSFLILQVGADFFFFFCQDGSQVWVKEKIGEIRVGAFDMEPSSLLNKIFRCADAFSLGMKWLKKHKTQIHPG